jgi:Holliday junction resolvase
VPDNVTKGRNLEYSVRDRLRALGYTVFRCAGSRPVDLVAIKEGRLLLVECKTGRNPYLSPTQVSSLLELSKKASGYLILAVRRRHRRIRWFKVAENGIVETMLG